MSGSGFYCDTNQRLLPTGGVFGANDMISSAPIRGDGERRGKGALIVGIDCLAQSVGIYGWFSIQEQGYNGVAREVGALELDDGAYPIGAAADGEAGLRRCGWEKGEMEAPQPEAQREQQHAEQRRQSQMGE